MPLGMYILNEFNVAVPCENTLEWAEWMGLHHFDWHLVDTIAGLRLSTVFMGLDHSFDDGDPVLWETMLFNDDEDGEDIGQWRFTSAPDAEEFHDKKVQELKNILAASLI